MITRRRRLLQDNSTVISKNKKRKNSGGSQSRSPVEEIIVAGPGPSQTSDEKNQNDDHMSPLVQQNHVATGAHHRDAPDSATHQCDASGNGVRRVGMESSYENNNNNNTPATTEEKSLSNTQCTTASPRDTMDKHDENDSQVESMRTSHPRMTHAQMMSSPAMRKITKRLPHHTPKTWWKNQTAAAGASPSSSSVGDGTDISPETPGSFLSTLSNAAAAAAAAATTRSLENNNNTSQDTPTRNVDGSEEGKEEEKRERNSATSTPQKRGVSRENLSDDSAVSKMSQNHQSNTTMSATEEPGEPKVQTATRDSGARIGRPNVIFHEIVQQPQSTSALTTPIQPPVPTTPVSDMANVECRMNTLASAASALTSSMQQQPQPQPQPIMIPSPNALGTVRHGHKVRGDGTGMTVQLDPDDSSALLLDTPCDPLPPNSLILAEFHCSELHRCVSLRGRKGITDPYFTTQNFLYSVNSHGDTRRVALFIRTHLPFGHVERVSYMLNKRKSLHKEFLVPMNEAPKNDPDARAHISSQEHMSVFTIDKSNGRGFRLPSSTKTHYRIVLVLRIEHYDTREPKESRRLKRTDMEVEFYNFTLKPTEVIKKMYREKINEKFIQIAFRPLPRLFKNETASDEYVANLHQPDHLINDISTLRMLGLPVPAAPDEKGASTRSNIIPSTDTRPSKRQRSSSSSSSSATLQASNNTTFIPPTNTSQFVPPLHHPLQQYYQQQHQHQHQHQQQQQHQMHWQQMQMQQQMLRQQQQQQKQSQQVTAIRVQEGIRHALVPSKPVDSSSRVVVPQSMPWSYHGPQLPSHQPQMQLVQENPMDMVRGTLSFALRFDVLHDDLNAYRAVNESTSPALK